MKRIIIFAILIIAAVGWYVYHEYNRTNEDLKDRRADFTLSAPELIAGFEKDTAAANRKYVDKVLAVSGAVKSIDRDGNPVVISLGETGQMSSVQCSMDSTHANDYRQVKEGDAVVLKGICTGGKSEELFGTDVVLARCVVETKH